MQPLLLLLPSLVVQPPPQELDRHPVTESYAFGSPELLVLYEAADLVVVNSNHLAGGGRQWAYFDLGLTPFDELDAFSDGSDIFPVPGPGIQPPADCRVVVAEHTVDPAAVGKPGGVVAPEAAPGANGAASDTFSFEWSGSSFPIARHASDHLEVTPLPGVQTDLDALAWSESFRRRVYFSLDRPTAAGYGVSPADVLTTTDDGGFDVLWSASELGLSPLDDIDALAVQQLGPEPSVLPASNVVFSLTPDSPSLTVGPLGEGPGALYAVTEGTPEIWAFATQLDLAPPGSGLVPDNLNGVRITDPVRLDWCDGDAVGGGGTPHDTLRLNGSDGGFPRVVETEPFQPVWLTVEPLQPTTVCTVYAALGKPCAQDALFLPGLLPGPVVLPFSSAVAVLTTNLPQQLQGQYAEPFELTLHGASFDIVTLEAARLNLLTLRVR
ncbi:MAG: hypothetical protein AAFZ65_07225 [Planctomycetota bacterium]